MSESVFKQGDTVMLVSETGKQVKAVDYVTKSGVVVIYGAGRFRQDGTATNNLGRAHIEHLSVERTLNKRQLASGDVTVWMDGNEAIIHHANGLTISLTTEEVQELKSWLGGQEATTDSS